MLRISASEITTYKRCREEHRVEHVLGLLPHTIKALPLEFGSALHQVLEALLTAGAHAALAKLAATDLPPFELARLEAMLAGYVAFWPEDELEVLAVEQAFELPRDGYVLAGRIDAIVRGRVGRVLVVEHKTTSDELEPGSPFWSTLTIDDQIGIYLPGARALGFEPSGVLYDVLRKPRLQPAESEAPSAFRARVIAEISGSPERDFARRELVRLEDEERAHRRDLLRVVSEMETTYAQSNVPALKTPSACRRYRRLCAFVDLCAGRATLEDVRARCGHPIECESSIQTEEVSLW